jgi:parvulin-like peptidyl-prolyl isomerase
MKKCIMIFILLVVCCAKDNTPKDGAIRVNGTWIKKSTVDRIVELYKQEMTRSFPEKSLTGLPPNIKKSIARQLIANEVVLQEAKKRNTGYNAARLTSTLEGIKKQFPDSAALKSELAKIGQTEEDMKSQIKDGLLVDSLLKTLFKPKDSVSVKACKEYYDSNQAKFASEKRYRVSQILFLVKKGTAADKKNAIAQKAAAVLAEIKAGKDFATLAKKKSEDTQTAAAGGDIGWFKKGDLQKEFETAAVPLKENEVSGVFETPAGFHIVKKTAEETLPPQPFDKVKDQIKNMLELKKQNDVVKQFVDSLVSSASIVYADTAYKGQ